MVTITPETKFKNQVQDWLISQGIYMAGTPEHKMDKPICGWFVKIWGGGMQKEGIPDILMNVHGFFISLELKSKNGRLSALQKKNTRMVIDSNGIGLGLYPDQFEDFKELIETIGSRNEIKVLQLMDKINERWDK